MPLLWRTMASTEIHENDIKDEDNLSEDEHDAIGDNAPHHPRSHAISSTDHIDIAQPPVTNGFLKWNGTQFIYETTTSGAHSIESHIDVVYNRPVENDDILKYSAEISSWVLAKESEHLLETNNITVSGINVTVLGVIVTVTE